MLLLVWLIHTVEVALSLLEGPWSLIHAGMWSLVPSMGSLDLQLWTSPGHAGAVGMGTW